MNTPLSPKGVTIFKRRIRQIEYEETGAKRRRR